MAIPQIVAMVLFVGVVAFFAFRGKRTAPQSMDFRPGLERLRAGFTGSREQGESEPICVVAFHYSGFSAESVIVGVTNRRVLVVKGAGAMTAFPYDEEGEHLGQKEKDRQKRGFFRWSHGPFNDGSTGYGPKVVSGPYAGEEWRMYPAVAGFDEQKANLREFASRFYFQWFYD